MNKQIEEMANDYYEAMLKARGTLCSMNEGAPKWYAKELYDKGWRKSTDVAREIFEEIEKEIKLALDSNYKAKQEHLEENYTYNIGFLGIVNGKIDALRGINDFIAELKKKYESEGADDE